MKLILVASCVVGVFVWGCSQPSAERNAGSVSPRAKVEPASTLYGDYVIGEPVSHENLTIFPILSRAPKNDDRFITLDEGLAAGTVKIIEIGAEDGEQADPSDSQPPRSQAAPQTSANSNAANQSQVDDGQTDRENPFGPAQQDSARQVADEPSEDGLEESEDVFGSPEIDGEVNKLLVLNTSDKPLYLMPGEVISGGKQDRTIGQEVVIASSEKPVPIDVFCVEHGRWGGRSVQGTTAQLAATAEFGENLSLVVSTTATVDELAQDAERGKFVASVGQLSKDARLAVQEAGDQGKVWEEVAKTNSKIGNESESDNFAANYLSGEVAKDFEPFMKKLRPTGETKQIVGVAVAVNGKMLSVDVFESTPLFRKFWPKLLKSYALDAVAATSEKESGETRKAIAVEDCVAFLKEVELSKALATKHADGQTVAKRRSSVGTSFTYYDAQAAEEAGVAEDNLPSGYGGGGFGGGVHTSVLAE